MFTTRGPVTIEVGSMPNRAVSLSDLSDAARHQALLSARLAAPRLALQPERVDDGKCLRPRTKLWLGFDRRERIRVRTVPVEIEPPPTELSTPLPAAPGAWPFNSPAGAGEPRG